MLSDDYLRQVAAFLEGAEAELRDRPGRRQPAWMAMLRDLLAECRRLREPPDVSGLLTEAELDLERAGVGDVLLAHVDAQAALIRELYGVVADLHADDPGRQALLERGRAEGRWQAARAVEAALADVHPAAAAASAAAALVRPVRALGPCRPPLPPAEAEREAGRLREALRQCLERLEWVSDGHGLSPLHFAHAIEVARAALGEDV